MTSLNKGGVIQSIVEGCVPIGVLKITKSGGIERFPS